MVIAWAAFLRYVLRLTVVPKLAVREGTSDGAALTVARVTG